MKDFDEKYKKLLYFNRKYDVFWWSNANGISLALSTQEKITVSYVILEEFQLKSPPIIKILKEKVLTNIEKYLKTNTGTIFK